MPNDGKLRTWKRLNNGRMIVIGPGARVHKKQPTKLHHGSWMTTEDMLKIKEMSSQGFTQAEIAEEIGVSKSTVSRVVRDMYKSVLFEKPPRVRSISEGNEEQTSKFAVPAASVAVGLHGLAEVQAYVSSLADGALPEEGQPPTPQQVRDTILALVDEILECMHELDWKPWKRKDSIDVAKVTEEFADVLAFLGLFVVLLKHLGINPDDLALAYAAKSEKNEQRLLGQRADYKARELSKRAEEILAALK